ncbi:MAG: SDR family NAD(P)-dependent oxidoreductase [Rhizorhabdus sp.]
MIVTGGASNIGRAIARTFGEEGASVVIVDFDAMQAERTAADIRAEGGSAEMVLLDVTDAAACTAAAERIETDGPVDILINNVGWNGRQEFFLGLGPERWEQSFRRNLFPTFAMTHAVLPYMVERREGAIVSISSDAAFGEIRVADYGAMKAGVLAFSRAIAREYGRYGIRSNAVMPGMVIPDEEDIGEGSYWNADTGAGEKEIADIERQIPLRRRSKARDVAWTTAFLASGRARQLTGQVVSVSGGFAMPR